MKTFIATVTFGEYVRWSKMYSIKASSKAVAEKRALEYAKAEFDTKPTTIFVEQLTAAKKAAFMAAADAFCEEFHRWQSAWTNIVGLRLVVEYSDEDE